MIYIFLFDKVHFMNNTLSVYHDEAPQEFFLNLPCSDFSRVLRGMNMCDVSGKNRFLIYKSNMVPKRRETMTYSLKV